MMYISIHALREEGDPLPLPGNGQQRHFYPRPPRGGRRTQSYIRWLNEVFLSTPSARRATRLRRPRLGGRSISIHALREEGDAFFFPLCYSRGAFLSTPSARRATTSVGAVVFWFRKFLSTPSARRATHSVTACRAVHDISIHALREEGDNSFLLIKNERTSFLSTPSARRATNSTLDMEEVLMISIHALREEGDDRQ